MTKTGVTRLSLAPTYFSEDRIKSDVKISDEVRSLISAPLKAKAKKAKKTE